MRRIDVNRTVLARVVDFEDANAQVRMGSGRSSNVHRMNASLAIEGFAERGRIADNERSDSTTDCAISSGAKAKVHLV